ncbi:flagellar basal body-associated FliL family protein [Sphingomonas sp. VNH70]|uniref:flagellar basal body-associated FliL family protein n=1 Tax=Sphingomonas silueang TaxID=3156617 RepID=UPI0032B5A86A
MSDKDKPAEAPVKKKGKFAKIAVMGIGMLVLLGGGVGAGLYASSSGLIGGGGHKEAADPDTPRLVPKSEETKAAAESGGGGEEGGGNESASEGGKPTPEGEGGDKYASSYYAMDKEFTANLADSVHFAQVGIAVSTPYDHKVLDNLKTHEIAVRSAVLMALGEATEDQVFTAEGKKQLALRLKKAINDTLEQKEGFGGIGNVYFTNFVVQ